MSAAAHCHGLASAQLLASPCALRLLVRSKSPFQTGHCNSNLRQCSVSRSNPANIARSRRPLSVRAADKMVDNAAGDAIEEEAMEKMDKCFEVAARNFSTVRTGRANPSMLDRVQVDYYGTSTPLRQIAGISAPDAQSLVIQPYDVSAMPSIEKAISKADLGVTPNNDGKIIRLNLPALTKERRQQMIKQVAKLSEDGKVAMRNVRRDANKQVSKLEKDNEMSEDAASNLETTIQELTDEYVKKLEKVATAKSDELSSV